MSLNQNQKLYSSRRKLKTCPLTSLDATVRIDPVVNQQHQTAERRGVERKGCLEPPQLCTTAAMSPVFAEIQYVSPDKPQVVHGLQLCSFFFLVSIHTEK